MKDIYINMANQNILRFYGSKLDLKVDYSELYDFELSKVQGDYNVDVLDFTHEITYTGLTIDSSCLTGLTSPWEVEVNTIYTGGTCNFKVRRRTEKGWTLDLVFDRLVTGTTFYYLGIKDDLIDRNYADNNLTFSFTNDNKIKWEAFHYSGLCNPDSGYTESYYTSTGKTPQLCPIGIYDDFNITITFDRYKYYYDCEIENEGGFNDLILGPHAVSYTDELWAPTTGDTGSFFSGSFIGHSTQITTGYTMTTGSLNWITGDTEYSYVEELNKKWAGEKQKRLGTLKIYHNGKRIYKLENFEEIIPSLRSSENSIVQIFGSNSLNGVLKQVKYFEEPLDFVHVNHHYFTSIKPNYSIYGCSDVLPSPTPTPTPSITPTKTVTPTPTPTQTGTPTPTPTPSITPTNTVTPTNTPTITPSPTQAPVFETGLFNFDFDYMLCEYFFSDGSDMDTMTYVSNPLIMNNDFNNINGPLPGDYVGTCASSSNGPSNGNWIDPFLLYGGDNLGTGTEAILFDLNKFKTQYPSTTDLELTFTATWYGSKGFIPVIMKSTMWKGGTPIQDGYTFINTGATQTKLVKSNGTIITSNTQNCEAFEIVDKFEFNVSSKNGYFLNGNQTPTPTPTPTNTETPTSTPTPTVTPTNTPTPTGSETPTPTPTNTVTPTETPTNTPTPTITPTNTVTPTPTILSTYTNTAEIFYDAANVLSYSGGTTLTNIGTLGNVSGTLGTISGVTFESGIARGVFNFSGNTFANVRNKITFDTFDFGNELTTTAWIYPRDYEHNDYFITLMSNAVQNSSSPGFKMVWRLNYNEINAYSNQMLFENAGASGGSTRFTSSQPIIGNTWQHIAYKFDKTNRKISFYHNGILLGAEQITSVGVITNQPWVIGSFIDDAFFMNANLGEFRVYKTLRSDSNISDEYNNTKSRYGL